MKASRIFSLIYPTAVSVFSNVMANRYLLYVASLLLVVPL